MRASKTADDLPADERVGIETVFADPVAYLRALGIEAELVASPQAGPLPIAA